MTDEASDDRDSSRRTFPKGLLGEFLAKGMPQPSGPPPRFLPVAPTFSTEKLEEMARKRDIEVGLPGWQDAVIWQAAIEHKELDPDAKTRGRPIKYRAGGLLSRAPTPAEEEDDKLLDRLEIIQLLESHQSGKRCSMVQAIRIYEQFKPRLTAAPAVTSELFASNVKVCQNKVSKARERRRKLQK